MTEGPVIPAPAEEAMRLAAASDDPEAAALMLAEICRRSASLLHHLARHEAEARHGGADWSRWAKLLNSSRDVVIRATALRDAARAAANANRGQA